MSYCLADYKYTMMICGTPVHNPVVTCKKRLYPLTKLQPTERKSLFITFSGIDHISFIDSRITIKKSINGIIQYRSVAIQGYFKSS